MPDLNCVIRTDYKFRASDLPARAPFISFAQTSVKVCELAVLYDKNGSPFATYPPQTAQHRIGARNSPA